jgi:hypothetical protein
MIPDDWPRIAGMHVRDDGDIGCVWMAHDKDRDLVHLYDACLFQREVLAVIAEALNARGRFIPVAWTHKEIADDLLERGVRMLPEPCDDSDAAAEVASRDVWSRMRSHRFKVERSLRQWSDEFESYNREGQKVPRDTHPLMSATRYAVQMLPWARRSAPKRGRNINFRKVAIV